LEPCNGEVITLLPAEKRSHNPGILKTDCFNGTGGALVERAGMTPTGFKNSFGHIKINY
jgi:hypothetical protein